MHKWHCPLHISLCKQINHLRISFLSMNLSTDTRFARHMTRNLIDTQNGNMLAQVDFKTWWRKTTTDSTSSCDSIVKWCEDRTSSSWSSILLVYMYECLYVCRVLWLLLNTLMSLAHSWTYVFGGGFECDLWLVLFYLRLIFDFFFFYHPFRSEVNDQSLDCVTLNFYMIT